MQQQSRHAVRASRAEQALIVRRRRKKKVWLSIAVVLLVLLGAAVWVGFRALSVKTDLEAAQTLVTNLDDGMELSDRVSAIGANAAAAAAAANDPIWRVAEYLPFGGDNLRAVRLASDSLDLLVNDVAAPALASAADPTGSLIVHVLPILEAQAPRAQDLALAVEEVRESRFLVGPVRSAIDLVTDVMGIAAPVMNEIPRMLGADGSKSYLLVFQNNAEVLPLGGSAASQTLITADAGQIAIAKQASATSFRNGEAVDVEVDPSALELYSDYLVSHVNTSVSRPDFPTAARILRAFWQRDVDPGPVDAVISIDPIALGRILLATGPIEIGGVEINSENATTILLSEVYKWWNPYASVEEAAASDAFFAGVAQTVFARISAGDFNVKDMAWALKEGVVQGDILAWSDDPGIASLLEGQRVAGVLPTTNDDATTVGVYFRDRSASKIDFYMNSAVALSRTCAADGETFTASVSLDLDLTQEEADALPDYVKSATFGSAKFWTEVFVYGPPGTTVASVTAEGSEAVPVRSDIDDLGRPAAVFDTYLPPGGSATVTAAFTGSGDFGPLELRLTPMIRQSSVDVSSACG